MTDNDVAKRSFGAHDAGRASGVSVAIMQPYLLPYIGYFQLIAAVDLFIVYDNIKYTKKGWINRNRILLNGAPETITVPLESASDSLDICARSVSPDFRRRKLLGTVSNAYRKAPQYGVVFPLFEQIVNFESPGLFEFLLHSLVVICSYLKIATPIERSSRLVIGSELRGQNRVVSTCLVCGASRYVNASGGVELYSSRDFASAGITLQFLRPELIAYRQFEAPFVPWLSILDVLMFNSVAEIRESILPRYALMSKEEMEASPE